MIYSQKRQTLFMDFSSDCPDNNHPSDIDLMYIGNKKILILGEIKNQQGVFKIGQKHLYEELVNGWKHEALCMYITHNKFVENGDTKVNVMECPVKELYYNTEKVWRAPKRPLLVKDVINYYKG